MKKIKVVVLVLLGVGMFVPITSYAQWYIGAEIGQTNADIWALNDMEYSQSSVNAVDDTDETDSAWKIFGGYNFTPNFSMEAGYAKLGEYNTMSMYESGMPTQYIDITEEKMQATTFYTTLIGRVEVHPQWNMFGRVGLAYWNADVEISRTMSSNRGNSVGSGRNFTPVVGLGFEYQATNNMCIRIEGEQFQNIGEGVESTVVRTNPMYGDTKFTYKENGTYVNVFGLAIIYHFRK